MGCFRPRRKRGRAIIVEANPHHTLLDPFGMWGFAGRFPGARDTRSFWHMLANGIDTITDIPADRFDAAAFYDPRPGAPGKMSYRWGGFVDDIEGFDAAFFGISP